MRGSIRTKVRGKRYEIRVALGRDPVSGRYRQKSVSVRGSRAEAERALRRLVEEIENGDHVQQVGTAAEAQVNFAQLLDEWLSFKDTSERSPTTIDRYRRCIEMHLKPALGHVPIKLLTPKAFDDLYRKQLSRLKPATVRKNHLVARAALDRAVRWGWIERNPAALAQAPTVHQPPIRLPSADELAQLVEIAEERDPVFAVVLRVGAATGARRGEICALRWSDIKLDDGTLTIERGIIVVRGGVQERETKTRNRRVVAIDDGTVSALRAHRRREAEAALACGATLNPDAFVFSRRPGGTQPLRPDNCTTAFVRIRKLAGLSGFSMKDATRHLAATRLIGAGVDVRTVAGRLGHSRASTTLDIYSHFLPERDREAAEIIGQLLDEGNAARKR